MIVRALDDNHDFTFGTSLNNYLRNKAAVIQNIDTRLNAFLGDCFFDLSAGINWFNLIGTKDQVDLNIAITSVIANTDQVLGLTQLSAMLTLSGNFSVAYTVQTTYGQQVALTIINPTLVS